MQASKNQEAKNLITEIAVKKLEINQLQKELARLEKQEQEALWSRYQ